MPIAGGETAPPRDAAGALIVTAVLDPVSQAVFEAARQRHFPAARNFIPAHVTLFHALPGGALPEVERALREVCGGQPAARFTVTGLRFLGRGVAYELAMPGVAAARAALAQHLAGRLTAQDSQKFRPHVTVQNKVAPEVARALFSRLKEGFSVWSGAVTGLKLWRYEGGPWGALGSVAFTGHAAENAPAEGQDG